MTKFPRFFYTLSACVLGSYAVLLACAARQTGSIAPLVLALATVPAPLLLEGAFNKNRQKAK